jgi:glycosyltransferase involved in cell wall biosynthesis
MRVLVYEQLHAGHYYYYPHYLLPGLLEITDDVVCAVTAEGRSSPQFNDLLAPYADRVRFEAVLPSGAERMVKNERLKFHTDLREAVRRFEPDYVLVPSGDQNTAVMGLFRLAGLGGLPGRRPGEIGIHFGWGSGARTSKEVMRDRLHALQLSLSGWRRAHLVNHLFYEWVQARGGALAARSHLLPHPVKANHKTRDEGRRQLGLPLDGRMLGISGVIDRRKAVRELLDAFIAANTDPTDRLLLAGPLTPAHRKMIERDYQPLVASGRLILLDRFFDADATQEALASMDIVCTPYPGFSGLSSVLLEGMAAGRPILTNRSGWCQMMVERFDAGWVCDVTDPEAFTRTIRTAFSACAAYRPSPATTRLLDFHAPENFAESFLHGLRELAGMPATPQLRSWSWVTHGLAPWAASPAHA